MTASKAARVETDQHWSLGAQAVSEQSRLEKERDDAVKKTESYYDLDPDIDGQCNNRDYERCCPKGTRLASGAQR